MAVRPYYVGNEYKMELLGVLRTMIERALKLMEKDIEKKYYEYYKISRDYVKTAHGLGCTYSKIAN